MTQFFFVTSSDIRQKGKMQKTSKVSLSAFTAATFTAAWIVGWHRTTIFIMLNKTKYIKNMNYLPFTASNIRDREPIFMKKEPTIFEVRQINSNTHHLYL